MVTRYEVLSKLYGKSPLYLADIAPEDLKDSKALLKQMAVEGYVLSYNSSTGPFYLTDKGRVLYLEIQEALDEEAEKSAAEKIEKKADRRFQILMFVLGLFAEHFTGVIDFCIDFLLNQL